MSAHLTDRAALCALGWDRPDGATLRRRSAGSAGGPEAEGQRHGALVLQDLCRRLWEPMPRRKRCRRGTWPSAAPPHSRTVENSFARTKISPGLVGCRGHGQPLLHLLQSAGSVHTLGLKDVYSSMFFFLVITKTWEPRECPSVEEWLNDS